MTALERETWLEKRTHSVGASESAAAIGVNPRKTPVQLWQQKTGRATRDDENEAMLWGSLLEPVILGEYERRSGVTVGMRQEFVTHPVLPFMTATLDGMTEDGRLIEVKTTSAFSTWFGEEGTDEIPEYCLVQVHHQMACTGATRAELVALVGGQEMRVYPITRDNGLVNAIEDRVGEFWRCVETDTPPTWGRLTARDLAVIFPKCHGEADWDFEEGHRIAGIINAIEERKVALKAGEFVTDEMKAEVLKALGNAKFGRLPDGREVRRYVEEVAEKVVSYTAKAYTRNYFKVMKGKA